MFPQWLDRNEINLHQYLILHRNEIDGSTSVRSINPIQAGTQVATIPKRAILSHRTCSWSSSKLAHLDQADISSTLRLTVCVLHELSLGAKSQWSEYLATLPEQVAIAVLWPVQGEARKWIVATELSRELEKIGQDLTTLTEFYDTRVAPLLVENPDYQNLPSLQQFLRCYSLVSSRAFMVDCFHTHAFVPIADAFNHSDENHVHFESEYWVCPDCGAYDECEHDQEEFSTARKVKASQADDDDVCGMLAVREIETDEEIFNSYGEISNARLLANYGFTLEGNQFDRISFDFDEIESDTLVTQREWHKEFQSWNRSSNSKEPLPENELIFHHDSADFFIDADAKISSALWILIAMKTVPLPKQMTKRMSFLQKLYDRSAVKSTIDINEIVVGLSAMRLDALVERAFKLVAAAVIDLCSTRISRQYKSELSGADLLDLAEGTASEKDSTVKIAIEFLANERSLLETVKTNWEMISVRRLRVV